MLIPPMTFCSELLLPSNRLDESAPEAEEPGNPDVGKPAVESPPLSNWDFVGESPNSSWISPSARFEENTKSRDGNLEKEEKQILTVFTSILHF